MNLFSPFTATLLPFVGALTIGLMAPGRSGEKGAARSEVVRSLAVVFLGLSLVVALTLALGAHSPELLRSTGPELSLWGSASFRPRLSLDGAAEILMPCFLIAALVAVIAAPRRELEPRTTALALGTLAAGLLVTVADDGVTLAFGWTLGAILPALAVRGRRAEAGRLMQLAGGARVVFLLIGVGLAVAGADVIHPFDLESITSPVAPFALATLVLVTLAALTRMAVFPMHLWLVPFTDAAPPLLLSVTFACNAGLVLLLRVALPIASALLVGTVPIVAIVGLVAALHSALRALAEPGLRRVVALVVGSQLGTILVGASVLHDPAAAGSMVGCAAVAFGATGLILVVNAVEARVGPITLDPRRISGVSGLAEAMPRASFAWFALMFAVVGIPGSLAFVAEDLVLHGVIEAHPFLAVLTLLASVINAVTLFRAGTTLFLGAPRRHYGVPDLLLRERVAVLVAFALVLGMGLWPGPVVGVANEAAQSLQALAPATSEDHPAETAH